MKIGVLTSSRADYGIYLPLLNILKNDIFFELEIIAFGTHLSKLHGYTLQDIINNDYKVVHKISNLLTNDDRASIASSYGLTVLRFSDFWDQNSYDLVFCLGDRFEMSAAVQAGIPFGVKLAHIHGGETTLGAIDNIYRHQMTIASAIHFTTEKRHSEKVQDILGSNSHVHTVGALSLDEIESFKPLKKDAFYKKHGLQNKPFALVTFHPETVSVEDNSKFTSITRNALAKVATQINLVITMPNADTLGSLFRKSILELKEDCPNEVVLVENFGKRNYFTAMHYASLLIGNTSSGIIEAASFKKFVVNVGDRQKGRLQSDNVIDVNFDVEAIYNEVQRVLAEGTYTGNNIYYQNGAAKNIINVLKKLNDKL